MSKKKNKKKSKNKYLPVVYNQKQKKNKKMKKDKYYKEPKLETKKESLDKKDIRAAHKIVTDPPEANKVLLDIQSRCNHAGEIITIKEYKDISVIPTNYTRKLDLIESVFGKNALICKSCYQVLVDPSAIDVDKLRESVAYLHGAGTAILPRKKFKKNEIKKINKRIKKLDKWDTIINTFDKLASKGAFVNSDTKVANNSSANLNNVSGAKAYQLTPSYTN